jgi:hypothetical protein
MKGMYKKLKKQISQNKEKYTTLQEKLEYKHESSSLYKLLEEIDKTVRGGLSDSHTPESIAKKHSISVKEIEAQIKIGKEIEMEHTNNPEEARRVAMDHLVELPDYYTRLVKMEKDAEKELKEYYKLYEEILAEEKLPDNPRYAVPADKMFPLFDRRHVLYAAQSFNLVNPLYEEKAARAIIRQMKIHGMRKSNIPSNSKLLKYLKDGDLPE